MGNVAGMDHERRLGGKRTDPANGFLERDERIRVHRFDVEADVAVRGLRERECLRRSRRRFGAAKETQRLWYAA